MKNRSTSNRGPKHHILLWGLLLGISGAAQAQAPLPPVSDTLYHIELGEITILKPYVFANKKEEKKYKKLERDIREIYPFLMELVYEYHKVKKTLPAYGPEREKDYLKWYETHARKKYMKQMMGLSIPQGKLLLKLLDRELDRTPYELLQSYRNHSRATFWQGVAALYLTNLDAEYVAEDNPMIEDIMQRIEQEQAAQQQP